MDIVAIEQVLTTWVAGVLGLNVDVDVFRGSNPEGEEGVVVLINGEIGNDAIISPRTYNVQVLAKYADRDKCMRISSAISGAVPLYHSTIQGYKFGSITARGNAVVYSGADNGVTSYYASINLLANVLTKGSQV